MTTRYAIGAQRGSGVTRGCGPRRSTGAHATNRSRVPALPAFSAQVLLGFLTASASGQTILPSQVTPESARPPAPVSAPRIERGESGPITAPMGAETLVATLGSVTVEGGFPDMAVADAAAVETLAGRRVTLAELYAAAAALEQAYARAGYVLARVTVPPQQLEQHGPLRLIVVDGFIEDVKLDGLPPRLRRIVKQRLAVLIGRRHMTLEEIERKVLIAGDTPGARLRSALMRGTRPGGVLLVIEGELTRMSASVSVDNHLPKELGRWQLTTTLALNDALGGGDQFYTLLGTQVDVARYGFPTSPSQMIGVGAVLPINDDGLTINPEYLHSRTQALPTPFAPVSVGSLDHFSLRLTDLLIRDRSQTLTFAGSVEHIQQTVDLPQFDVFTSRDQFWLASIGSSWQTFLPWKAPVFFDLKLYRGLGGRGTEDVASSGVPLSRQGASTEFTRLTALARLSQPLAGEWRVDAMARAQTDFRQAQLVPEQFQLDGDDAVSVFPTGTINVDRGATIRGELIRTFTVGPALIAPYAFGATGSGELERPTAVEQRYVHVSTLGLGVNKFLGLFQDGGNVTLTAEAGQQFGHIPGYRDGVDFRLSVTLKL